MRDLFYAFYRSAGSDIWQVIECPLLRTAIRFARPIILSKEMAACLLVIVTYAKRNRMIYE